MMSASNECYMCRQTNKITRSSVMCTGCTQRFCGQHHHEHRQLFVKDFERLIEQHNILRQQLFSEKDGPNSTKLNLLKKIDNWERDMIQNIQETAATTKTRLLHMINDEKDQIKSSFTLVANELKVNQSGSDFVETDIQKWQDELRDCKQKFEQLMVQSNGLIDIDIKLIDVKDSISIHRKSDVKIRTRFPTQSKTIINTRDINYQTTENSSREISRRVGLPSTNRSQKYQINESADSSNPGDGCFHGSCTALSANGSIKHVKNIRRGDVLRTSDGSEATVTYVIKIKCTNGIASMVTLDNGLIITPWHPIRIDGNWTFPHNIHHEKEIECQEMYNFVLDRCHIIIINGFECVTLGHNLKGDVIEHSYFGTANVVDDLRAMDTLNTGFIEILPNSTIRDNKTKLVTGYRRLNENFQLTTPLPC